MDHVEQGELRVLESIRSMTREELDGLLSEGVASGSTDAMRGLFAFAHQQIAPAMIDLVMRWPTSTTAQMRKWR
jgi:hypothetical protein